MGYPSSKNSIITLGAWLRTPLGNYMLEWEQALLDSMTADIFGFNAMQIGAPKIKTLQANRMRHRWLTNTYLPGVNEVQSDVVVTHNFAEFPFASQSLDLVVLPHVLEFAAEPHQILREVERVLIPEGQVIICGFNPASLWGIRQTAGRIFGLYFLPQNAEFISLTRLKDWLKLLNMVVNRGHFGRYAPPHSSKKWLHRFGFMEEMGNRWWPYCGAVYIVQAIKRVKGMHLISPAYSKQAPKSSRGVPVTNKIRKDKSEKRVE